MIAEFNKSFLIKLPKNIHIYNSVNNIDINQNIIDHIFQKFLLSQISFRLSFFRLNLKVGVFIILF